MWPRLRGRNGSGFEQRALARFESKFSCYKKFKPDIEKSINYDIATIDPSIQWDTKNRFVFWLQYTLSIVNSCI